MADVVQDIKSRLDIYDVVSQYVQLKKNGRNFKGLCPFHSEKTPSFVVSQEKQICHCFGCGKGGDIFTFIQEVEGATFSESLQILADRAGVKIDNTAAKHFKKEHKSEKDEYFLAHTLACEFFEKQLLETNDGKKVLEYLYKRGVKDETIREFRLGFAPDKYDELYPYLLKKGISKATLLKSGLISAKNLASDSVYDKYRGRLIFPIFDYFGRICGFGGRALKQDQSPKYLNSPENPIYSKSKILYGLSHSKQHVKEKNRIILVEGYFDVILPYQGGVKNIAAVSGTALTSHQITLIKRITENIVTCFDMDSAGFEATKRAYELFSEAGLPMKTISGFSGKDPADFVLEKGGDAFNEFVDKAKDFVSFYIEKLLSSNDISVFEGRKNVLKELLPLFKKMSETTKDFYVRDLAGKLNVREQSLYDEVKSFSLPSSRVKNEFLELSSSKKESVSLLEVIISIVLKCPKLFKKHFEFLESCEFPGTLKDVYNTLKDQYNSYRLDFDQWGFGKEFLAGVREKMDVLLLYVDEKYFEFSDIALEIELEKLIDRVKKDYKDKRKGELQLRIVEAEKAGKNGELLRLLKEQQVLLSE